MRKQLCLITLPLLLWSLNSCHSIKKMVGNTTGNDFPKLSLEAHRGGRGLFPENSIIAMENAIDIPAVTTLEMDCHITKDKKVVVFHDDVLNPKFMLNANGSEITTSNKIPVYSLTYNELRKYDIGSKFYKDFPQQKKIKTTISKLADLIQASEVYAKAKRKTPMFYNIEIKSSATKDGQFHPAVSEFSDLVIQVIVDKKIAPRTVIQSFDLRALQYVHKTYPQFRLSYLIDDKNTKTPDELIKELGFKPFIISPNYKIATAKFVNSCHDLNVKVIPWTPNSKQDIDSLRKINVDGIITDYPNLF